MSSGRVGSWSLLVLVRRLFGLLGALFGLLDVGDDCTPFLRLFERPLVMGGEAFGFLSNMFGSMSTCCDFATVPPPRRFFFAGGDHSSSLEDSAFVRFGARATGEHFRLSSKNGWVGSFRRLDWARRSLIAFGFSEKGFLADGNVIVISGGGAFFLADDDSRDALDTFSDLLGDASSSSNDDGSE